MHYGEWMSWNGLWMTVAMIAFWGGLILLVAWAIRSNTRGGDRRPAQTPTEILDRRFASGELDERTYLDRLDTLRRATPGGPPPA
ncbi:MAG: hypothetical protein WD826_04195 [Actinomycetota bacterium]